MLKFDSDVENSTVRWVVMYVSVQQTCILLLRVSEWSLCSYVLNNWLNLRLTGGLLQPPSSFFTAA